MTGTMTRNGIELIQQNSHRERSASSYDYSSIYDRDYGDFLVEGEEAYANYRNRSIRDGRSRSSNSTSYLTNPLDRMAKDEDEIERQLHLLYDNHPDESSMGVEPVSSIQGYVEHDEGVGLNPIQHHLFQMNNNQNGHPRQTSRGDVRESQATWSASTFDPCVAPMGETRTEEQNFECHPHPRMKPEGQQRYPRPKSRRSRDPPPSSKSRSRSTPRNESRQSRNFGFCLDAEDAICGEIEVASTSRPRQRRSGQESRRHSKRYPSKENNNYSEDEHNQESNHRARRTSKSRHHNRHKTKDYRAITPDPPAAISSRAADAHRRKSRKGSIHNRGNHKKQFESSMIENDPTTPKATARKTRRLADEPILDELFCIHICSKANCPDPSACRPKPAATSSPSFLGPKDNSSYFYVPLSLIVQRDMEMNRAAQSANISADRWNGSLLMKKCNELHSGNSKQANEGTNNQEDPKVISLHPVQALAQQNVIASSFDWWQPWLTFCIRAYYNTGTFRVPSHCHGLEILLALEYFGILYSNPEQLVFDSTSTYQKVKQWSKYFSHRAYLAQWVVDQLQEQHERDQEEQQKHHQRHGQGPQRWKLFEQPHIFCTHNESLRPGWSAFIDGLQMTPVTVLDGGAQFSEQKSNNAKHNSARIVHGFFVPNPKQGHDNEEKDPAFASPESVPAMMREDFAAYLQHVLPETEVSFKLQSLQLVMTNPRRLQRRKMFLEDASSQRAVLVVTWDPMRSQEARISAVQSYLRRTVEDDQSPTFALAENNKNVSHDTTLSAIENLSSISSSATSYSAAPSSSQASTVTAAPTDELAFGQILQDTHKAVTHLINNATRKFDKGWRNDGLNMSGDDTLSKETSGWYHNKSLDTTAGSSSTSHGPAEEPIGVVSFPSLNVQGQNSSGDKRKKVIIEKPEDCRSLPHEGHGIASDKKTRVPRLSLSMALDNNSRHQHGTTTQASSPLRAPKDLIEQRRLAAAEALGEQHSPTRLFLAPPRAISPRPPGGAATETSRTSAMRPASTEEPRVPATPPLASSRRIHIIDHPRTTATAPLAPARKTSITEYLSTSPPRASNARDAARSSLAIGETKLRLKRDDQVVANRFGYIPTPPTTHSLQVEHIYEDLDRNPAEKIVLDRIQSEPSKVAVNRSKIAPVRTRSEQNTTQNSNVRVEINRPKIQPSNAAPVTTSSQQSKIPFGRTQSQQSTLWTPSLLMEDNSPVGPVPSVERKLGTPVPFVHASSDGRVSVTSSITRQHESLVLDGNENTGSYHRNTEHERVSSVMSEEKERSELRRGRGELLKGNSLSSEDCHQYEHNLSRISEEQSAKKLHDESFEARFQALLNVDTDLTDQDQKKDVRARELEANLKAAIEDLRLPVNTDDIDLDALRDVLESKSVEGESCLFLKDIFDILDVLTGSSHPAPVVLVPSGNSKKDKRSRKRPNTDSSTWESSTSSSPISASTKQQTQCSPAPMAEAVGMSEESVSKGALFLQSLARVSPSEVFANNDHEQVDTKKTSKPKTTKKNTNREVAAIPDDLDPEGANGIEVYHVPKTAQSTTEHQQESQAHASKIPRSPFSPSKRQGGKSIGREECGKGHKKKSGLLGFMRKK